MSFFFGGGGGGGLKKKTKFIKNYGMKRKSNIRRETQFLPVVLAEIPYLSWLIIGFSCYI